MISTQERARDIFLNVLELASPPERSAYVEAQCGHDDELKREVGALLDHAHRLGGFLASRAEDVEATTDRLPARQPGEQIGPYKLLEQIGEGGMGLVYMAEQQQPVRRLVALKIIKPGMDTKQVIARFEAERQALAMMDHPNIAKVLDAGTVGQSTKFQASSIKQIRSTKSKAPNEPGPPVSDIGPSDLEIVCDLELGHCDLTAGRPYFVMELVRGVPLNEFCDQKRLTVRERLQLFMQVCQAVQHAHQKGVIHRDLKPTNVLVTMNDTVPFPKLLDFGIAKALGQSLTDSTLHTGYSQLVGTPLYMSPEQAEMNLVGVDTRSDVYSLGVMLYELLTGTTPFDKERLKSVTFDELRRIIREEEPETVSARIAKTRRVGQGGESRRRPTELQEGGPAHASSELVPPYSELDWIAMKALEKDRSRRYESASALAADIQRYLSDEPVLACPPTTMYRFQKIARKHKSLLTTAAAVAACLVLGTTVSAWQAVRATTAEAQANANEQKAVANAAAAEQKEQEAIKQRDEVKALADKLAANEQQLQRTLYAAHMNLARHTWEDAGLPRVEELLELHRPKPGETDLRGFEWNYLNRLCHSDLLTLKGHTGELGSVVYSPDGKSLASTGGGELKMWNAQTGQELLTLKLDRSTRYTGVAFSPDGKHLASAGGDKVKVWDVQTGQELLAIMDAGSIVSFSPDGKRLASNADDNTLKVWDAQTGQELLTLKGHTQYVFNVVFSPDGKRLASATYDDQLKVWDAQSGQELLSLKGGQGLAFSPDSKRLASGEQDTVKVWDAQSGKELLSLKGRTDWIDGVAFSPDGNRLASGSWLGVLQIWDLQTGQEIRAIKGGYSLVAFSPDGKNLVSSGPEGTIKIWDAQQDQEIRTLQVEGQEKIAISPDWQRLARALADNTVQVRDVQTGNLVLTLKGHTGQVLSVVFSPDGRRLASGGRSEGRMPRLPGEVKVWDAQTGQELLSVKGGGRALAFSPDSKRLAGPGEGGVKVWDAQTGQEQLALTLARAQGRQGQGPVMCVVFSPDGKRLAAVGQGQVKVWDAQTGQELLDLKGHTGKPSNVTFSPDGKRLASASQRLPGSGAGEVKVWDALTGQELLSLKRHVGHVMGVAFSPDGQRLASGAFQVKLWDAQTGQELLTLKGGGQVVFSADGNRLMASSRGEDTVQFYDATPLPEKP